MYIFVAVVCLLETLGIGVSAEVKREIRLLLSDGDNIKLSQNAEGPYQFWRQIGAKYPELGNLIPRIFALPNSNAQTERIFSLMKAVHTPTRNSLILSTINNILSIKVNKHTSYTGFDFGPSVKRACKEATDTYNKLHKKS